MNYRKWKKNYKKKNGVNPPIELDKRKQSKVAKKAVKAISKIDCVQVMNDMVKEVGIVFQIMGQALIDAGEYIKGIDMRKEGSYGN